MQARLSRLGYGNADISSGLDSFWLGGSLRISPREQVALLARLAFGEGAVQPGARGDPAADHGAGPGRGLDAFGQDRAR